MKVNITAIKDETNSNITLTIWCLYLQICAVNNFYSLITEYNLNSHVLTAGLKLLITEYYQINIPLCLHYFNIFQIFKNSF